MNPRLVLSLALSSLTTQRGYYFLSSVYTKFKLWPKTTKRDYGRAKKWTQFFWVLIHACYRKLIFHLLLYNNQSVNPIPIHLQPDGVLICGGHFISCWQFHKPLKPFPPVIYLFICGVFPHPPRDSFLQDSSSKPFLSSLEVYARCFLPGAGITY